MQSYSSCSGCDGFEAVFLRAMCCNAIAVKCMVLLAESMRQMRVVKRNACFEKVEDGVGPRVRDQDVQVLAKIKHEQLKDD